MATPTWTATPSVTASATGSPTSTVSPTATPTNTPGQSQRLQVFNGEGSLVVDLGGRWAESPASALVLVAGWFTPEQGPLGVSAGGSTWIWSGADATGTTVPDGPYSLRLSQPGRADLQASVWVRHAALALGRLILAPQPALTYVTLLLAPPPGLRVELRVHDLGGALVAQWSLPAGSSHLQWDLCTESGRRVSAGIYLVEARYLGPGTCQSALVKLAVLH